MNGAMLLSIIALMISIFNVGMKVGERQEIKEQEQYQLCLESGASVEYCEKIYTY